MTDAKDAIVKRARECLEDAVSSDRLNREAALDDLRFVAGRQWTDDERTERGNRPTITINRLAQAVRQVTGDLRRTNPAINVMAADGDARQEVAEVIEGLVRHIEQASDASSVYEGAAERAAAGGIGWFRVRADYEDDESFDQTLRIEAIPNSFSVYCDPAARHPTRKDARWLLITEEMDEADFEAAYPEARKVDAAYDGATDHLHRWRKEGQIVVAEYFWKEARPVTLSLMQDGSVVEGEQKGANATRTAQRERVMWAKVSGVEVLEGPQPVGIRKYIPVIAVTGEEIDLGGEVVRTGVVTHAKDAQRVFNYWSSVSMEVVASQSRAPWLVTAPMVANWQDQWKKAHDANLPFLPFDIDPQNPGLVPQRVPPPVPSSAVLTEIGRASDDIKATTGIYDAALGARSNETSGKAIQARQQESDLSTSVYADNMGKAVGVCGEILVEWIPVVFDTPRTVRIVGKDDVEQMVRVNEEADPVTGMPPLDPQTGRPLPVLPLTVGKYDVRVSVGPNYSTKRQQTADALLNLVQSVPQVGQIAPDLIVKSLDIPDADQLADRLKSTLPPTFFKPEDLSPEERQRAAQAMQQQQAQQQMAQRAAAAEISVKEATAAEKMAKAQVAGVEAQAALMSAQGSPEAPQDPRAVLLELQEAAARVQEIVARVGLIGAQTEKTRAETVKTTVEALTPKPPPAPPRGQPQPAR